MKLLVGLGNPGPRYANTRHNLGYDALERLVRDYGLASGGVAFSVAAELAGPGGGRSRFKGLTGDGRVGGERVFWLFPDTYMNLSGESVGAVSRFRKLEPEDVIVFHDDLDLPLGKIKMKRGGGNAGHNGLKSIQQHLGTPNFVRIRLGIGRPATREPTEKFVLNPFTQPEREAVEPGLEALSRVFQKVLKDDFAGALNDMARLLNPPPPKKEKAPPKRRRGR